MYHMEKTPYGYSIRLKGTLTIKDLEKWSDQAYQDIKLAPIDFKLLIDATELHILCPETKNGYEQLLDFFLKHGLTRSCILYQSSSLYLQLRNICAHLTFPGERYINIKKIPSYKRISREWLVFGTEPKG